MRRAFTIIELMVVIAIIVILAGILLPMLSQARGRAREAACMSNARQIGQAEQMYADDYDGWLPIGAYNSQSLAPSPQWDTSWHNLLLPYLDERKGVFFCPGADGSGLRWAYGASPWLLPYYRAIPAWQVGGGEKIWLAEHQTWNWPSFPRDYLDDPSHSYLTARHNGRSVVLFLDGHVRSVNPDKLSGNLSVWQP